MRTPVTMQDAVKEAERKARRDGPIDRGMLVYYRAKQEFDLLDAISRTRALSEPESRALERAMNRMEDWAVRQ